MKFLRDAVLMCAVCVSGVANVYAAVASDVKTADTKVGNPASVVLVELFTSEGCSSCPPADDLLRQVNGQRTANGQQVVGLSEHVTYWNGLGWQDPYSLPTFTDRQSSYSERFGLQGVYTPQMVIDGREQIVGSDRGALGRSLQHELKRPQIGLHIVSTQVAGGVLSLQFSVEQVVSGLVSGRPSGRASGLGNGQALDIMAVIADDTDKSNVLRGENSGRALEHVSVARYLMRVATIRGDTQTTVKIPLPAGLTQTPGQPRHLILFAQQPRLGPVVGTDTRPFRRDAWEVK